LFASKANEFSKVMLKKEAFMHLKICEKEGILKGISTVK
jgi:hypothetical protein